MLKTPLARECFPSSGANASRTLLCSCFCEYIICLDQFLNLVLKIPGMNRLCENLILVHFLDYSFLR